MIGIIDSGLGNVQSVRNMLKSIGIDGELLSDPARCQEASRLILPGIGSFDEGVRRLRDTGFREAVLAFAHEGTRPLLGVCLGMQMLLSESEEGDGEGLGLIPGRVVRFHFDERNRKLPIPNMGWRDVRWRQAGGETARASVDRFYFVHSYHAVPSDEAHVLGESTYGYDYCCAVRRGLVTGVQFHPEKSHRFGKQFFRQWCSDE